MYTEVFNSLKVPEKFQPGSADVWTDNRLSDFVLNSHLDNDFEGASKDEEFINESVDFIQEVAPVHKFKNVVDLGCGPGLYAEKLFNRGYNVTGYDLSENSIKYAKEQARHKNLNIEYHVGDILEFNEQNKYDLALIIYQIYGLFNPEDRKKILINAFNSLKPEGKLILDVLSEESFNNFDEQQTWSFSRKNSPISKEAHIGFSTFAKYPDKVTLQKTTFLFENGSPLTLNYWNTHFNQADLTREAQEVGFTVEGFYADVNGHAFNGDESLAVVLRK